VALLCAATPEELGSLEQNVDSDGDDAGEEFGKLGSLVRTGLLLGVKTVILNVAEHAEPWAELWCEMSSIPRSIRSTATC
jgi:hypothetical protein